MFAPICLKVKPHSRHNFPIEIRQGKSFRISAHNVSSSSMTLTLAWCVAVMVPFAVWSLTEQSSLRTVRSSSFVNRDLFII